MLVSLLKSNLTQALLIAYFSSVCLTPLMIWFAKKLNWLAWPKEDRWHQKPVALMGGIAVYLSVTIGLVYYDAELLKWLWGGATILSLLGFLDDKYEVKPLVKLLAQLIATSLLLFGGYEFGIDWPFYISIPMTFIWVIGITNAVNLLDNMDGLSPGVGAIIAATISFISLSIGNVQAGIISGILAVSLMGFLIYNFNPAKIFMGDVGSLFIGYMLAALPLTFNADLFSGSYLIYFAILVSLYIIPIFDTTLVTAIRIFKGRSVSTGGQDHSSHRLVMLGLSERQAVLVLYLIGIFFSILSVMTMYMPSMLFYTLLSISLISLIYFGVYLTKVQTYKPEEEEEIFDINEIPDVLKNRVQLAGVLVDLVLVVSTYALAYYLRFESWSLEIETAMVESLPIIILINILCFYVGGLYRGIWSHAGLTELVRVSVTTMIATVSTAIFVHFYSVPVLSVSVFAIYWMLVTMAIGGARFSFKALRRMFACAQSEGKNVLLYGAGDAGWLALSEIRHNPDLGYNPVGFIDDSPFKKDRLIQGLKVLGTGDDLDYLSYKYNIDEVLVAISELDEKELRTIQKTCQANEVKCKVFRPTFIEVKKRFLGREMVAS